MDRKNPGQFQCFLAIHFYSETINFFKSVSSIYLKKLLVAPSSHPFLKKTGPVDVDVSQVLDPRRLGLCHGLLWARTGYAGYAMMLA